MHWMRQVLLILSAIGIVVSTASLGVLSTDAARFEDRLRAFAVAKVKSDAVEFAGEYGITLSESDATGNWGGD